MDEKNVLDRALGLFPATTLVIGSVIGSGIFVSTASMARTLPSGWQLLGVWVFAGAMTALGALTQAELCSRLPVTGGLYAYFRVVFGDAVAFFYGWANFMIAGSGAIAALAFIFASFLRDFVPLWQAPSAWAGKAIVIPYLGMLFPGANLGEKLVGTVLILLLTALNVRGVRLGALVQSASTTAKTLAILFVIGAAFALSRDGSWRHLEETAQAAVPGRSLMGLWFVAMSAAFWAYDGWGNAAYVGGEIRDPQKNLPRSILLGTGIVISIYVLINLAYLYALPLQAIGAAPGDRVASAVMGAALGPAGVAGVAALVLLSTFDTLNSSILVNARVYFAMGNEGLFWSRAGKVHPAYRTPAVALWMQGIWAIVLLLSGSFELITSMYVFVNWLFYLLIPIALFLLRRIREKNRSALEEEEIFHVPAYPYLPLAFAAFTLVYLVQTLLWDIHAYQANKEPCIKSLMGLALVFCGAPVLALLRLKSRAKAS